MNAVVPQKQNERLLLEMSALMVLMGMVLCLGTAIASQLWLPHARLPMGAVTPMCVSLQYGRVDVWWNANVMVTVAQARAPLRNMNCIALPWTTLLPERGNTRLFDVEWLMSFASNLN